MVKLKAPLTGIFIKRHGHRNRDYGNLFKLYSVTFINKARALNGAKHDIVFSP